MQALVIGGTRNLGPGIVAALLERGYSVAVLHRGITKAELPRGVEELFADRTDSAALRAAVGNSSFDVIVDTTLYHAREAEQAIDIFKGRAGRYVFLSTGAVYLVRTDLARPFREQDYEGPIFVAPPATDEHAYRSYQYGANKRAAEDVFAAADFPCIRLRLPNVHSERDHYSRIHNYLARLWDGGPLVLPDIPHLPVRHVYGADVVAAITKVIAAPKLRVPHPGAPDFGAQGGIRTAYNIGQDETYSVEEFLALLASAAGAKLKLVRVPEAELKSRGLLYNCSPFSDPWMSALDNALSKRELGMQYTPTLEYVAKLVAHYRNLPPPSAYTQRSAELELVK